VLLDPDVEPHRAVEGGLLVHEQVRQLVAEGLEILGPGEVALGVGPAADRVDDAGDQRADARLALGRAKLTPKVRAARTPAGRARR
jgi:hypothetical protein